MRYPTEDLACSMQKIFLLALLLLPTLCVAQKDREKKRSEEKVRSGLIQQAEVATAVGELDSAQALLAKALWLWPDSKTNAQQARLYLMRSDTVGYCKQMGLYSQESEAEKAFYEQHCTRKDSVPFAASGLSATEFPSIINVSRVWSKGNNTTTYTLYDGTDSLRYRVLIDAKDTLFAYLDQMPRFPGGEAELFKFLGKNTRYPSYAVEHGISGVIYITFIVERDGRMSGLEVLRGRHHSLDAESLRVIGSMPAWEPGRKNGKPVRCRYNLPVRFTLR